MIEPNKFAIRFDPTGEKYSSVADIALTCNESSLIYLLVIIAGVLIGSNIFFFKRNKKILLGIIVGFFALFGLLIALANFVSNDALAQQYGSGASFAPNYPDGYYSCPSTWETFIDSWPKYLFQTILVSIFVFIVLLIISLIVKHLRRNSLQIEKNKELPEQDIDAQSGEQVNGKNTISNTSKDTVNTNKSQDSDPSSSESKNTY